MDGWLKRVADVDNLLLFMKIRDLVYIVDLFRLDDPEKGRVPVLDYGTCVSFCSEDYPHAPSSLTHSTEMKDEK